MQPNFTRQIAQFAVASRVEDVPPVIRHEASRALVNWIGNPISASRHETTERALNALSEFSGPRNAHLLGRLDKIDIFKATFINCLASSIYDFDDTHLASVIHPTGPIASVLLALSEYRKIRGSEFLQAYILGVEFQCRIANAIAVAPAKCDDAWFLTGITGGIGAAITCGRILGLSEQQMIWAISIAAARAAGSRETHGTMSKNLIPASAAETGMQAAFLARRDFTASDTPIEGPRGLGHLYAQSTNFSALVRKLGKHWELTGNAYKPFPSGIVTHAAITAALNIASEHELAPKAIKRIDLIVHPLCLQLCGRRTPRTAAEGTFSVYHWVAIALLKKEIRIHHFDDNNVIDPQVIALRDCIEAMTSDEFSKDEAHVRITLADGRILECHVDHAIGSIDQPMSDEALNAKLHDLADRVIGNQAVDRLSQVCWGIEREPDASIIVRAACGSLSENLC